MLTWRVAFAKSLTWKVVGVITLLGIGACFNLDVDVIGKVTLTYHVVTFFMFLAHERLWHDFLVKRKG
jgi:uncharacterized membrane protein